MKKNMLVVILKWWRASPTNPIRSTYFLWYFSYMPTRQKTCCQM